MPLPDPARPEGWPPCLHAVTVRRTGTSYRFDGPARGDHGPCECWPVAFTTDDVWRWELDTDPDWGIAALGDEPLEARTPGDLLAVMASNVPAWLHRVVEGRDHPDHRREAASQLVFTLWAIAQERSDRLNTNSHQIQTMLVELTL